MAKRSKLTDAEKVEVVLRLLRKEEPASKLARRYGISEHTLYRYRDRFLEGGKTGLLGNGDADARIRELERAVEERERVIGELTVANRVLKKTADGLL